MKKYTDIRPYLPEINISYARGWEEALRRFDAAEGHQLNKRKSFQRVA